jgi:hypothetical protein
MRRLPVKALAPENHALVFLAATGNFRKTPMTS